MCLYPKIIKNKKYTSNKKNGGNIPPIKDERTLYVPIGCQKCMECRKQKARSWQARLLEDIKTHKNAKFITLTYSNEAIAEFILNPKNLKALQTIKNLNGYQKDNEIATVSVRLFLERFRKEYKKSLRHWLVTELGHNGTENIHLHGIIWTDLPLTKIEEIWQYGFMWKGKSDESRIKPGSQNYVNAQTINYIVKYINKQDPKHPNYISKILTSPGIGSSYVTSYNAKSNKYQSEETNEAYRTSSGHKVSLPIYWRNKIYSEDEREKLWLNKLDKEERYVMGEKISIKNGYSAYDATVEFYRRENERKGFGSNDKNNDEMEYEIQRRNILNETRIKKAQKKWTLEIAKHRPV